MKIRLGRIVACSLCLAGAAYAQSGGSDAQDAPSKPEGACTDPDYAATLPRPNDNVEVRIVETETGSQLVARNLRPGPAETLIRARGEEAIFQAVALPPLETTVLMEFEGLAPTDALEKVRTEWSFTSYLGNPGAISPDEDYSYRLPFAEGETYRLTQGFDGRSSHTSRSSRYALDFGLDVGEAVHAARGGTVVRAVDWFCRQGGEDLVHQANMIIIAHDDGTLGHYAHLDHEGALVEEGDRVVRGQHIGNAGITGKTRGPHLHFVVRKERDIAIPIRFEGYEDADLSRRGRFSVP